MDKESSSAVFKTVFLAVFFIWIILLGTHIALAIFIVTPTEVQKDLIASVSRGWQGLTVGIIGMLGGKVL